MATLDEALGELVAMSLNSSEFWKGKVCADQNAVLFWSNGVSLW